MRHYYSEMDEVTTTFTDIHKSSKSGEYIKVYHEKPVDTGFHYVEYLLPDMDVIRSYGFSSEELQRLEEYTRNNAPLIWEIAREDGEVIADNN